MTASLDLALVGNGTIGALVDPVGEIVWSCFPRFDGDPTFCTLLQPQNPKPEFGYFGVELLDAVSHEQEYLANTPVLVTRLQDGLGGAIEIVDCAPRFRQYGRMFCPMTLVRQIRRTAGNPRVRVRLRPAHHAGAQAMGTTTGSNHIRYIGTDLVLRLTTDASITAIGEENPFFLEDTVTLLLGQDDTVQGAVADVGRRFLEETIAYWREWVRYLGIPFEWQDAVIRAAITLKL
ncbi:MAG TPA: trehalase-like domain-containing protein, partial [Gemmatimonadales bacterium]